MEAVILAGGLGTRLREVVKDVPKPMAPVNGKPFLHYIFQWLAEYPVTKVVLSVGYLADKVQEYFGEEYCGIKIEYAVENTPLGTGGGIKNAVNKVATADDILIVNGDTYFPIDLERFMAFHQNNEKPLSIGLKHMTDFDRYGCVELTDDTIVSFQEKKYLKEGLINAGIYAINKKGLKFEDLPEVFSFEKEVLEKLVAKGEIAGVVFDETFIDIGIPEDYNKAINTL